MASEVQVAHAAAGKVVVFDVRNAAGQIWKVSTSAFVTYATADIANYVTTATEQGTASKYYVGNFPAGIVTAGDYNVTAYERAGGSHAETDMPIAADVVRWDGAAEVPLYNRLAPTVAGRTLDVTATGAAGIDWANVEAPTTTVGLSGTTVKNASDVPTSAAIATAVTASVLLTPANKLYTDANGYTKVVASPHAILGSVNDAAATTTSFIGDSGLSTTNDAYKGMWVLPTSGTWISVPRKVTAYTGATRTFAFSASDPWPTALANGTTFEILGHG